MSFNIIAYCRQLTNFNWHCLGYRRGAEYWHNTTNRLTVHFWDILFNLDEILKIEDVKHKNKVFGKPVSSLCTLYETRSILSKIKNNDIQSSIQSLFAERNINMRWNQGLVKGAKLCLNPYFFGWLRISEAKFCSFSKTLGETLLY